MALAADLIVQAHGGETLDALIWRILGRGPGAEELVLAANPGLANIAASLPEGARVLIPAAADTPAATLKQVELWD
ncbi:tail protein X [Brevundimonas nasdae]|uniref:tail protein X n=1 Tax=Brevundimonas nasdae TaxID=172043 RepID=UPI003F68CCEB